MKFISSVLIALISFIFLVAAVSAVPNNAAFISSPSSVSQTAGSFQVIFNVTNNDSTTGNVAFSYSPTSGSSSASFSQNNFAISAGNTQQITATISFGSQSGTIAGNILVQDASGASANQTVSFSVPLTAPTNRTFCDAGRIGTNLSLDGLDISSSGDDDNDWRPLDKITVEVSVNNDGDSNLKEVVVELGIFDSAGHDVTNDFDFTSSDEEKYQVGTLDNGDDDKASFEFEVPGDLDDADYTVVAKAYSKKSGESSLCTDSYANNDEEVVSIGPESDKGKYIAFNDVQFSPSEAVCGDSVTMDFDVVNVGENDQDQVSISITSKDLKIDQTIEIRNNLNTGDSEHQSITFTVPSGLTDKLYPINLDAEYEYKNGVYRESLDDVVKYNYKVFGCSASTSSAPVTISASLASDAVAGKPMTIRTTVVNTGSTSSTFTLDARNVASWATVQSISDRIFTLGAGESKTVEITLLPNSDASGQQSFSIEVSNGDKVTSREVAVNLGSSVSSSSLSSLFQNKLAWIIGLVNVILIVLIIVVAVKISRR